jgi:Rad3-related DNA helicase
VTIPTLSNECDVDGAPADRDDPAHEQLRQAIEHATHLLPSQGPISVFVHHNTLHAFEELPFEQAVLKGGQLYHCDPYLSEERYRREFVRGRIRLKDLEAVLLEDLGDDASTLVATFGTKHALRLAMLQFPIRNAPDAELKWLIAETDAQDRFRPEVEPAMRDQMIVTTRHWVMRDLRTNGDGPEQHARKVLQDLLAERGGAKIESWSHKLWESFVLRFLWRVCNDGVKAVYREGQLTTKADDSGYQRLRVALF